MVNCELKNKIIQIVGPTASGKTSFSVKLANALGAEIINVDSMQVYKDIAIGSDKPSTKQRQLVPFHGLDLIELGPPLDASSFSAYADVAIAEITGRHKPCILSGGTGLYHRAILYGLIDAPSRDDELRARLRKERDEHGIELLYERLVACDPAAAAKIYPTDWVRIERSLEVFELTGQMLSQAHDAHGFREAKYERLSFGCLRPREVLYSKIEQRLDEMWASGILEETQKMLDLGLSTDFLPLKALGYRQAALALTGQCSIDEALSLAKRETRRFAKRQMTWFRSDKDIQWIDMDMTESDFETVCQQCKSFLS